ncbi:MAG: M14 family zinc carboxypeptidase [Burkholderiaceae bacterium]
MFAALGHAALGAMFCGLAPVLATTPCVEFARTLPNVSQSLCTLAGLQRGTGLSVQQRPLWLRELPPADRTSPPVLKVLVVGAIHGDELSSASLALHWLRQAQQSAEGGVQRVHWLFIPALNPDGLMAQPPRRVNARGVDLNRNFPTRNWHRDARLYWEKRTRKDPRRWPGKMPLSEPESAFLHAEIGRFKPNLIVSIHAPYGVLDFDGPVSSALAPPQRLGRLYLDQVGIFPGSLGNYGGLHQGVPVVTVELPSALRTPLESEMQQMWLDLIRWMTERLLTSPLAMPRGAENTTAR